LEKERVKEKKELERFEKKKRVFLKERKEGFFEMREKI